MSEPLSFCMVTTFYPPYHFGGDAMYVYRLGNALARRGHRVTVVHNVDAYRILRRGKPAGSFPHEAGVTVYPISSRLGPLSPLATYLTGRPGPTSGRLDEIFAGEAFDVVHFHNISLMGGPGVLSYGDGVKLYTMHEHWLVCPMHVLWKYDRRPCEKPSCLRCSLSFSRPPQFWRYTDLLERAIRHVDVFISPSDFAAKMHRERGFSREIRRLPYFVAEPTPSRGGGAPHTRPYFLFAGRLERLKGLQTVIDVFRRYDAADLVVAGDGDLEDELRRSASGLQHVRFLGRVHPAELGGLYEGALAVLVPTVGYEVFPFVALEALSHGVPVIAHDRGGQSEAVTESGGGFTYRTDAELLQAMEALRVDPALRRELGERGRATWRERWTEEAHLSEYFEIIEAARDSERSRDVLAASRSGE